MIYDQPDFHALARKLKSTKHVTRHKLWMDYLSQPCPTDTTKYQYSQFCSGLNEFLRANDLVEVITHEPGQELYGPDPSLALCHRPSQRNALGLAHG